MASANVTTILEGLNVSSGSGVLALASISRLHPASSQGAVIVVNPQRRSIPVHVTNAIFRDVIDVRLTGLMMGYGYGLFINAGTNSNNILSAYFTLLFNTLRPADAQATLEAALRSTSFNLEFRFYDETATAELFHSPELQSFIDRIGGEVNRNKFFQFREQQLVGLGVYLLIIGKNLQTIAYSGWVKNRIKTFNGTLGLTGTSVWTEAPFPGQPTVETLYSVFSSTFDLRRCVFNMYLSALQDTGTVGQLFSTVVHLLSGVEMTHLFNIEVYLFGKYSELLRIRILRDNMTAYNKALTFICSKPEAEHSYLKLLYNRKETACLNRSNFSLLASAGTILARIENASMTHYQAGKQDETYNTLEATIHKYLNYRSQLSAIGMLNSQRAFATHDERYAIAKRVTDEFYSKEKVTPELKGTAPVIRNIFANNAADLEEKQ